MKTFFPFLCLLLAGCGSGGNLDAVTPVLADVPGTYRLAYTEVTVAAPAPGGAVTSFLSYSTGTLRLYDNSTYTRVTQGGQQQSVTQGGYLFADSTSSILGSSHGSFTFTPIGTAIPIAGLYKVTPDFTLTLTYPPVSLPDSSLMTRSNVWVKQSDSPNF